MVEKTTPRLGLPQPYLTNPLKIDVGNLSDALAMLDANAVMLTDWDITADGWQKMGTLKGLDQGKIAVSLMVVTGTGFANILFQTGDGTVTTVGDPARISVSAQTNLGANSATVLGGVIKEVAENEYEIWFNIAPSTAPRKWSGLLIAGNGATIDWTHASGSKPDGGVTLNMARALTDSDTMTATSEDGAVITAGTMGLGTRKGKITILSSVNSLKAYNWRVGETLWFMQLSATVANGFPPGISETPLSSPYFAMTCVSCSPGGSKQFEIRTQEGTSRNIYSATLNANAWTSVSRIFTSVAPPTAEEVSAVPVRKAITTGTDLNTLSLPASVGMYPSPLGATEGAQADNPYHYPFAENGVLLIAPANSNATALTYTYVGMSGRTATRSYNGSVFTEWRSTAKSGENSDITTLKGLSGSLRLGGDAADDYDAVTLRQLKASTGTGGATMNGVVNTFIGSVSWFNGSRAVLPAGHVSSDGQLLKRSDYPEIWAAIEKGIVASVSDAAWLAGVATSTGSSPWAHRGKYSTGTITSGADANFRMPDLNGMQPGSVDGLFLRGSGKQAAESVSTGTVAASSMPNITGSVAGRTAETFAALFSRTRPGALYTNAPPSDITQVAGSPVAGTPFDGGDRYVYLNFSAALSNGIYGFTNQFSGSDGKSYDWAAAAEIKPPQAVGIWLIRVSGSFQAANTNFSVIAGDAAKPGNNTSVRGGQLISDYQAGGVSEMTVTLVGAGSIGSTYNAVLSVANKTKNTTANFTFGDDGSLIVPNYMSSKTVFAGVGGGFQVPSQSWGWIDVQSQLPAPFRISDLVATRDTVVPMMSSRTNTANGYPTHALVGQYVPGSWGFAQIYFGLSGDGGNYGRAYIPIEGGLKGSYKAGAADWLNWSLSRDPTSDERLKRQITDYDGRQSLSNIEAMDLKTFIYKTDEKNRIRRGVIAQQIMEIDPEYVHLVKPTENDTGTYVLDNNALLLDALCAIKVLSTELKETQRQLTALYNQ